MRRQHIAWTILVLSLVLTIYGSYSIIYSLSHNVKIPVLAIVFLSIGGALLLTYLVLLIISLIQKKNRKPVVEEIKEEPKLEIVEEKEPVKKEEVKPVSKEKKKDYSREVTYETTKEKSRPSYGSAYIKKVGYGPILRVSEEQILDMRSNTYYTIDGNTVKQNGYGPVYEIRGNMIKKAFGSYLYEISGSNVSKVYGGYYASLSGHYLQLNDLSEKYEFTDSLSLKQNLAVIAIIFGDY